MTERNPNLAASVAARLLNRTKQTGDDFQILLTSFCFERFLYRLGKSDVRDSFVLKGAMLLRMWSEQPYRATRDLDLLRLGREQRRARHAAGACDATPLRPLQRRGSAASGDNAARKPAISPTLNRYAVAPIPTTSSTARESRTS